MGFLLPVAGSLIDESPRKTILNFESYRRDQAVYFLLTQYSSTQLQCH